MDPKLKRTEQFVAYLQHLGQLNIPQDLSLKMQIQQVETEFHNNMREWESLRNSSEVILFFVKFLICFRVTLWWLGQRQKF
jgi:hypothetical protein